MTKDGENTPRLGADCNGNGNDAPESVTVSGTSGCRRCGNLEPAREDGRCPRCKCWRAGNPGALKEGAARLALALRAGNDSLAESVVNASIERYCRDRGGRDDQAEPALAVIRELARAEALADVCWRAIAADGAFTKAGKKRPVTELWLEASGRVVRHAEKLGLERRAKRIRNVTEYIEQQFKEQST